MAISKVDPIEKYIDFYKNKFQQGKDDSLNAVSAEQEYLKQQIAQNYNSGLGDINKQYADLERALLVQKLINERKTAEQNENLGLTNSGKNLSEQAAVQISYGNSLNDTKAQKARQQAELLTQKLANLSKVDIDTAEKLADIQKEYDALAVNTANSARNDDISALLKEQELELKKQSSSSGNNKTTTKTKTEEEQYKEKLLAGVKSAKVLGSGYLYAFLYSLNLTKEQLPILRTVLLEAGVPVDFYENFEGGAYQNLNLIPTN